MVPYVINAGNQICTILGPIPDTKDIFFFFFSWKAPYRFRRKKTLTSCFQVTVHSSCNENSGYQYRSVLANCWRKSVVVLASRWHSRSESADVPGKDLALITSVTLNSLSGKALEKICPWPETLAVCESVRHPSHNLTCCNYFLF